MAEVTIEGDPRFGVVYDDAEPADAAGETKPRDPIFIPVSEQYSGPCLAFEAATMPEYCPDENYWHLRTSWPQGQPSVAGAAPWALGEPADR